MVYTDTVKLLRECDAGTKMAVTSIDEVLDKVRDTEMKQLLQESKDHHEKLGRKRAYSHSQRNVLDEDQCEDGYGRQ